MITLTWENVRSEAARGANPERPLTHLSDLTGRGLAMHATSPCSVDDCERPRRTRGWCHAHYQRWRATGAAPQSAVGGYRQTCTVKECTNKHMGRGYCSMHSQRFRRHGDPLHVAEPGYTALHMKIGKDRGAASNYECAHCGGRAAHWAYDHLDPDERIGKDHGRMLPYSLDLDHYMPLCLSCHKRFDLAHAGVS